MDYLKWMPGVGWGLNGMEFDSDEEDFFGVRRAYELSDFDLQSLDEIELELRRHVFSNSIARLERIGYLEELRYRLSLIVLAEEREGILNWELREVLHRAEQLELQLTLPTSVR